MIQSEKFSQMHPCFSLILLAHNNEKTIGLALKSIFNQTILNHKVIFELISIPNGCTDNTEKIIRQKLSNFSNSNVILKYIPLKEGHRNKAINRGITEAKSNLIMYMNADCALSKNALNSCLNNFNKNKQLQLLGLNDTPKFKSADESLLLKRMYEIRSFYFEIYGKTIPKGRFIAFKKGLIDKLPKDIHSEDIWIYLMTVKKFGEKAVLVLENENIYYIPPKDWGSYINLQTRYANGSNQLLKKHPELKAVFTKTQLTSKRHKETLETAWEKIIGKFRQKGFSKKESGEFIQIHKTLSRIINENKKILNETIISPDGKWQAER